MSQTLALTNARLLDPASGLDATGGLLVVDGRIAEVGANAKAPAGAETVDCKGACLAPGLIDMRVHAREPGEEYKETIATAAGAAVAGGVTTMVCLPNTDPVIDNPALVGFVLQRGREAALANVQTYAALSQGTKGAKLAEIGLLIEAGAIAFTDGTKAIDDPVLMRRALTYAKTFDALIVQHPEEPRLAKGGEAHAGELSARLGLAGIPGIAEAIMLERDMRLVESTGGRYHAGHVSTGEGVEIIRRAKAKGLRVTADTAPHYFSLNENEIGEYRTFARLSPPLRPESDRQAVVQGLADGTIDVIASDHAPHDQESKRLPFGQAEPGIIGLETLLPLSLALHHNGKMSLLDVLRRLTLAPAELLGLPAGRLAKDAPADLVLFDLDKPWRVEEIKFRSTSKNSPFDNRPMQGHALRTIVGGRTVFTRKA
ncbi:MAG TPA: dihydroorotase [Alphaproteobacteria bacterium]|jgi:dihydroorotase